MTFWSVHTVKHATSEEILYWTHNLPKNKNPSNVLFQFAAVFVDLIIIIIIIIIESKIVAAQDQAIQTKYYAAKILNTETDSKCRLCQQYDETIDHITSACPIMAKEQYTKRHDWVHNYEYTST